MYFVFGLANGKTYYHRSGAGLPRYHEFTFIGFEAPPVYVSEEVKKEGYEPDVIVMMSRYGGGNRRGTFGLQTIFI